MKARLTGERVPIISKPNTTTLVHSYMNYKCDKCGKEWKMFCEKGIEEFGKNHKPSPFIITCSCGGMAKDISGLIKLGDYYPLKDNMSYFSNKKNSDCGVPVLR